MRFSVPVFAALLTLALTLAVPAAASTGAHAVDPDNNHPGDGLRENRSRSSNQSASPPGRRLSADQVLAIARKLPKMRAVQAEYPGSFADAYLKGPLRWQVSFFSRKARKRLGW